MYVGLLHRTCYHKKRSTCGVYRETRPKKKIQCWQLYSSDASSPKGEKLPFQLGLCWCRLITQCGKRRQNGSPCGQCERSYCLHEAPFTQRFPKIAASGQQQFLSTQQKWMSGVALHNPCSNFLAFLSRRRCERGSCASLWLYPLLTIWPLALQCAYFCGATR